MQDAWACETTLRARLCGFKTEFLKTNHEHLLQLGKFARYNFSWQRDQNNVCLHCVYFIWVMCECLVLKHSNPKWMWRSWLQHLQCRTHFICSVPICLHDGWVRARYGAQLLAQTLSAVPLGQQGHWCYSVRNDPTHQNNKTANQQTSKATGSTPSPAHLGFKTP